VPGCSARLAPQNASGVCRDHTHAPGHCACAACRPRENGADGGGRITLPVPPWARELSEAR
ncbi:MAG: hypothetical protein H5U20_01795, partial [Rhodobacteraceae bacterium]|nr:hypothetical protein [Paracoccaceae bacterium]